MNVQYKKLQSFFVAAFVLVGTLLIVLVSATPVGAADNLECGVLPDSICNAAKNDGSSGTENTAVWKLLLMVVNIMTAGVFVLALGGIVYASVLYTSAGSNQEQAKKARTMITNVVIGIIAFTLMFAVLQWLIPGGIFNGSGGLQAN